MLILKKLSLVILLIAMLFASAMVWATIARTLLVLDKLNDNETLRNFRTTKGLKTSPDINLAGFSELNMIGSAQFSASSLKNTLQQLHIDKITIFDLRQESHGFIDGNAISWYAPGNVVNAGKTPQQIEKSEAKRLNKLSKLKKATVYQILKKTKNMAIEETKSFSMPVHEVYSEQQLAKKLNLNYARIYVEDFHGPSNTQVDKFIKVVRQLPEHQWVYFHCRAGVGRTSTFMVMYDMMHNAKDLSFADIIKRQKAIGGKDLTKLPSEGAFKYSMAVDRLSFLKKFYDYARANDDDFETLWTEWIGKK